MKKAIMRSCYASSAADKIIGPPPCIDCPDRYPGCAGSCKGYKEWKEKRSEFILARRKEAREEAAADGVRRKCMEKNLIRRGEKIGTTGR